MKKISFTSFFCVLFAVTALAQSLYFPPLTGTTWQTVSPASLGWCQDRIDSLQNYVGATNADAFIVLKDGKIALEWYYGSFTRDSLHYWASAGKTLTSILVGVAQQEGLLSINDTTSRFLGTGWTSLTPAQERLIKIRHNLTMTTGLDDDVPDDDCTTPSCLVYKAAPGSRWAYHNAPYLLLQNVVANAAGVTYQQFTNTRIKQKTGMDGFWFNNVYYSTPRSMARFGLLLLNKGKWNTTAVLSDTAYFGAMTRTSNTLNRSYGYLTWLNGKGSCMVPTLQTVFQMDLIPNAPDDMYCALGKNDQKIYVVPSQNLVVIRTGAAATNQALALLAYDNVLWQKINELTCVNTFATTNKNTSIELSPNPANDILNVQYHLLENATVKIQILDITGKIIENHVFQQIKGNYTSPIVVHHLPKGIYCIQLIANDTAVIQKFVKM